MEDINKNLTNATNNFSTKSQESDLVTIGLFFAYLAVGFVIVFIMIGMCILSHVFYIKYLKKPWKEKPSKSVWFIELEKKKEKLTNIKKNINTKGPKNKYIIESDNESNNSNDIEIDKNESNIAKLDALNLAYVDSTNDLRDKGGNDNKPDKNDDEVQKALSI